jgi:integrase
MNDISGRDLHEFRLWRKNEGDLNKISMQTQMSTLRVFLKWCGSIEAVGPDLYNKVLVPEVSGDEEQRDLMLESDRADEILDHLSKYQYASREHILFALLWETGMRIGAARSLDLSDVYVEEECLELEHRPEAETTLKNGQGGERLVAISTDLAELLEDYIEDTRIDATDEYGRKPLLSGNQGRYARSTIRRIVYSLTAPCYLGKDCPDCNEGSSSKCPEAVNPHAIRRGSITHYLTNDVPVEIVGDRMDVSRKVLDKHYDRRSEEVKLEQRRSYLDNI